MNLRNLTRTYNYLSPRQKIVTAIAAVVGGGVLLCIPLLSLQPTRPPAAVSNAGGAGDPSGGQNSSGETDLVPSQAKPLDTANPIDLPSDSTTGTATESDSFTSSNSTNSFSGDRGSNSLDTTDPVDERVANRQRSSALKDTLSNNIDNPYSQSTVERYQTPASISNSPYSASGNGNLSTSYSRAASGSSTSQSSSQSFNLEPAKGNDFTYLNPFSPNSNPGTSTNPGATNLPGNTSAMPSQNAIAPDSLPGSLNSTGDGMNAAPTNGSSGVAPQTAPAPTNQNPSFPTPASPGNTPNR